MANDKDINIGLAYSIMSKVGKDLSEAKLANDYDERLNAKIEKIVDTANQMQKDSPIKVSLKDGYSNSLLSIGSGQNGTKSELFSSYGLDNSSINWMLWLALYSDSWVFRTAIDKPAQDEVNCGLIINDSNADEIQKEITRSKQELINLLRWGALFGGSVAFMMFQSLPEQDYAKPIDFNNVAIKGHMPRLYVTDRWYGVGIIGDETVDDMSDIDFGKPKWYSITLATGKTIKVHHSYIIRYEHRSAPMFLKKGMLQGWGFAEGAHIFTELSRDEKLKNSIQSLIDKSLLEIIKMPGMRGVFMGSQSNENKEMLEARLQMVQWARNFNSLTFLDKDDEYEQHNFSGLSGLSDIMEKNMWLISAALEMQGVLYGNLSNGFSSDSDALKRYDETIRNRCEAFYRPVLEKYAATICGCKGFERHVELEFGSLYKNETDKDKMDGMDKYIGLLSKLMSDGIITARQYAQAVNDYAMKGNVSISFSEQDLAKLDEDTENAMEGINIDEVR